MRASNNRRKIFPVVFLFASFMVFAAMITINTSHDDYKNLSNIPGTSIHSDFELKVPAGYQLANRYRTLHGASQLPQGSNFRVIWQDGTAEQFFVADRTLSAGTVPVPGTQQGAGGGSGVGGDGSPPGYGSGGGPFENCFSTTVTGCTSAGGGPQHCETISFLDCPFGFS